MIFRSIFLNYVYLEEIATLSVEVCFLEDRYCFHIHPVSLWLFTRELRSLILGDISDQWSIFLLCSCCSCFGLTVCVCFLCFVLDLSVIFLCLLSNGRVKGGEKWVERWEGSGRNSGRGTKIRVYCLIFFSVEKKNKRKQSKALWKWFSHEVWTTKSQILKSGLSKGSVWKAGW